MAVEIKLFPDHHHSNSRSLVEAMVTFANQYQDDLEIGPHNKRLIAAIGSGRFPQVYQRYLLTAPLHSASLTVEEGTGIYNIAFGNPPKTVIFEKPLKGQS